MPFAQIDQDGNVIKFPVRVPPLQSIPKDFVDVDIITNRPMDLKWYQSCWWDTVERIDDKYVVTFKILDSYPPNSIEKKRAFQKHVESLRLKIDRYLNTGGITQEQADENNYILDMVNPDDETTFDKIEKLEFNMYARIDTNGDVVEFPVSLNKLREVESEVVEVDIRKYKPSNLKWYQGAWWDNVVREDDKYFAKYRIDTKKFTSSEERESVFAYFVEYYRGKNEYRFNEKLITEEQYNANLVILNGIDVKDESMSDEFDKLVF
jgi:hypothetical protein